MTMPQEEREIFSRAANVSRETLEQLELYARLLLKWNKAINLVAPSTLAHLWTRHFLDSAQLLEYAPKKTGKWLDIGSGAGFPGLIVACLTPDIAVTCVESDQRKAVFLKTIIRELGLNANVISNRIEQVAPAGANTLSARALAPIDKLLTYGAPHLASGGVAVFLKGAGHLVEIEQARKKWRFDIATYPSKTDSQGVILVMEDIGRA